MSREKANVRIAVSADAVLDVVDFAHMTVCGADADPDDEVTLDQAANIVQLLAEATVVARGALDADQLAELDASAAARIEAFAAGIVARLQAEQGEPAPVRVQ